VVAAREIQHRRSLELEGASRLNALLTARDLERVAALDQKSQRLIEIAVTRLGLSARAFVKVLRVARTIADLENEERVREPHVAEAIQGRLFERESLR
ncbi:MAG: ATP-dependent protease, partial [Myxococcota bacterium]|nr:ATP-dependent protease [Myxococcota bacterium]